MLNVITTKDIRVKLDGNLVIIPMGSEIFMDKEIGGCVIDDYFVSIFPDEYMVVQ